jgi:hypothetical protein
MSAKREVFARGKGEGFDVKVLREILSCASRIRGIATNKIRSSTYISGLWRAQGPRKQRRHSRKAANFGS